MRSVRAALRWGVFLTALLLASCAGGSAPPGQIPAAQSSNGAQKAQSFAVQAPDGTSGTIALRANRTLPSSAVAMEQSAEARVPQSIGGCPAIPPIRILNPFPFPLTIVIASFQLELPCTPSAPLLGATFYQIRPQPKIVSPVKLGDAAVNGRNVTFTATAKSITLPAQSLSQIVVLPETSTASVAFPVAPGSQTDLTANAPSLPSGLTFTYATSSGASTYSAACFNAFDNGVLAPALQGVPLVGIPSFYCHMDTGGASVTFGTTVTFNVIAPKPDRAIFEPDGTAQGFACTLASACNVPQFSVPATYQNFIVGNVQDLRLCVPATPDVDCNGVSGDPQGSSQSTVPASQAFQVLVADDPTYKPGTEAAPVPWDGLFRVSVSGSCSLQTGSETGSEDVPPNYVDQGGTGTGPYGEFDVTAGASGTCGITVAEDPRYITDYANPTNPQPRSATLNLQIGSEVPQ